MILKTMHVLENSPEEQDGYADAALEEISGSRMEKLYGVTLAILEANVGTANREIEWTARDASTGKLWALNHIDGVGGALLRLDGHYVTGTSRAVGHRPEHDHHRGKATCFVQKLRHRAKGNDDRLGHQLLRAFATESWDWDKAIITLEIEISLKRPLVIWNTCDGAHTWRKYCTGDIQPAVVIAAEIMPALRSLVARKWGMPDRPIYQNVHQRRRNQGGVFG